MWRIVLAKIATLTEVREKWTLDDVMEANEILEYKSKVDSLEMDKARKRSKK